MKKLPLTPPHWKYFQRGCYSSPNNVDVYFCFEMVLKTGNLLVGRYSEYQQFLYDTIFKLHNEGLNFQQIADWLNENGITTVRGKTFRNNHVHSIIKKKRIRDEILNQQIEREYKNFDLWFVERKLINQT